MIIPRFRGEVRQGKLYIYNEHIFNQYLQGLTGLLDVVVRPFKSPRSLQQNRYYWGVAIKIMCDATGHDPELMHEILKNRFLLQRNFVVGEFIEAPKSTTQLTTEEMTNYLKNIQQWAAELGIYIPDPGEVEY